MELYTVSITQDTSYSTHTIYLSFHKTMTGALDAFVKNYNERREYGGKRTAYINDFGHIIQVHFKNNGGLYLSKMHLDEDVVEDKVYALRDGIGHYDIEANRQRAINKMVEHAKYRASYYDCPIQKQTETTYFVGQYVHAVEEFRVQD